MYTEQITQRLALGAGIKPQTLNNSNAQTDSVNMTLSKRAFFVVTVGANSGTLGLYLQESADNSTWPAANVASSFTNSGGSNVSQTGITANSKEYTFEVRADQLSPGKEYVRLSAVESASSNCTVAVVAYGDEGTHKPNNVNNASAVTTQNLVA